MTKPLDPKYRGTRAHNKPFEDEKYPYYSQGRNGTACTAAVALRYNAGSRCFPDEITLTPVLPNGKLQNAWLKMSTEAFTDLAMKWLEACGYQIVKLNDTRYELE